MPIFVRVPHRPSGLRVHALAAEPRVELHAAGGTISVHGPIDDVVAEKIAAGLRLIGRHPALIEINSAGGDFYAGLAAFNTIRGHSHEVTTAVLGQAASAASLIAIAGQEVQIARHATITIHRAHAELAGNAEDMRKVAEALDEVDATMAAIYAEHTGRPRDEMAALMRREASFTGQAAIDEGFADVLLERKALPPQAAAKPSPSLRELERGLTALGLSRHQAARAAAAAQLADETPEPGPEDDLDARLEAIARTIADAVGTNR